MMQNSSTTNAIKQELQPSEMYFLVVISIFQSVIGTVANAFTLATILLYGRLHQMPSNLLLLNLATVDLLSCVIFLPFHIYNLHQASLSRISRFFYHAQCLFHLFSNGNAIFAITADRFIAVTFSLRYKSIVTKRRIVVAIILSWLMPLLFSVTFYITLRKDFLEHILQSYEHVLRAYIMSSLLLVVIFYFLIYRVARRQINRIRSERLSLNATCIKRPRVNILTRSSVWKSTMNTFFIVCLYFVTYLPILIYDMTFSLGKQSRYTSMSERVYAWVLSFIFINSCIDPFLYAFRNRQFKKAFWLHVLPTILLRK